MTTFYSGQNGRLQIDGINAAKVTNWSISISQSPLSTTVLSETDNTFINGVRSTTGSCRLYYYDDTSGTTRTNSAASLIQKLIKARTTGSEAGKAADPENVTLKLQAVEGNVTREIVVEALITSASMTISVGEVMAADVAFQVNGAPTTVSL